MLSHEIGALLLGAAVAAHAGAAAACPVGTPVLHRLDTGASRQDTTPPRPPAVMAADATRRSGLTCGQESCVENNCGDTATVSIELERHEAGQTQLDVAGYRLELVSGQAPESMRHQLGVNLASAAPLVLTLGFDDVTSLAVILRAVAIDAAGNESTPSEPFLVQFNGCTLAAVGEECEHEFDPDGNLSYSALDELEPDELEPDELAAASQGTACSLPTGPRQGRASVGLAVLVGLLGLGRALGRRPPAP